MLRERPAGPLLFVGVGVSALALWMWISDFQQKNKVRDTGLLRRRQLLVVCLLIDLGLRLF
jgi:hypothetical protein